MAAAIRKLRYERLHWFLHRVSESGRSLTQGYVTKNTFSTSTCHFYSKSLPVMAKRRSETGTKQGLEAQGFANAQSLSHSFSRDTIGSKSRSKNSKYKREEKDLDSDPETESEDEEEYMDDKSPKSKMKTGKGGKFLKWKSQKSGNITLRPSRYLFKDFRPEEEEGNRWERRYGLEDRKRKMNWYARQMLRLTRDDKVEEALNLLASMKENKLYPTVEVYNIFISAYARKGQVRKAFKIFNDVKKRGMKPTAHTFSSLFNACAKASVPRHALQRVEKLLAEISKRTAKQELEMNVITYNAAIQALVVCGNPHQAFDIYQEMQDNKVEPDGHTFSSLLAACCFDKVEGPSTAFKILEEMKALQIEPDIYIFNSVLKVMRDFKVAAQEQKSVQSSNVTETPTESSTELTDDEEEGSPTLDKLNVAENSLQEGNNSAKQNDRTLELHHFFPGVEKFIQMMAVENVYPDVRTFQLLLYMTSSKEEEEYLMELMKSCNISSDATFYNTLIKMKAMDEGVQEAKVYIQELKETLKISPSEKSYQALAHGCKNQKQGISLLDEMKSEGITADQSVYGVLITGAAKRRQFSYIIQLVKRMTNDDVQPTERMMEVLERAYKLPCNKPDIARTMDDRLVKLRKFRYVEQRGFQTFFENWKAKVLEKETVTRKTGTSSDIDHYDDSTDETRDNYVSDDETSDYDDDSKFSHL
ncbi:hypothetical protein ACROYT_G038992 [Oculina patagonica]